LAFRVSYIAVEAYRGFRRNLLLAISMVIIVAISLTLFGIALLAGKQVSLFGGYWSDRIEVSVFLAPKIPTEQRDTIRQQLEAVPVVERVYYESKEDAYAVVLIAVTVRVAAFARRKETQIMKLVGASNTYIRLPFLAEGVVAGLLGTLIAFGLLRSGMFYLDRVRDQVSIFQILPAVGMREFYSSCIVLLALGVVASALASLLALRKYVRI
jgi:cell division protein FtsX